MKKARFILDKDYKIAPVDDQLYSTFLEHMGETIYGGLYDPGYKTADEQGFRQDVIDEVRALGVTAIRYPGGNFVSNFDWKDSIGPRESRPTRLELAYLAIEDNAMGLDEYVDWARKTDTEVIYTLNMGNPDCARDAGFLMDYCNFPGGTAWSDLRIKNGHKQPHNIKTWCLGNEMDGPWQLNAQTAENYGLRACETAKIMKWTDPEARLVVVGNSTAETKFPDWSREVLEHCYNHVDYLAIHRYFPLMEDFDDTSPDLQRYLGMGIEMDNYIRVMGSTIDYVKAKTRSKNNVYLSFDEYAPSNSSPHWISLAATDGNPRTEKPFEKGSRVLENNPPKTVLNALALGSLLIALINNADRVKIACQSIMIHSLIKAHKGQPAVRQTMFYPFLHASKYGRGVAMRGVVKVEEQKKRLISWSLKQDVDIPLVQSASVYLPETEEVNVFMLNADADAMEVQVDLRAFGSPEMAEHIALENDDLMACNDYDSPEAVVPQSKPVVQGSEGVKTVRLSPYSWNVLRFKTKEER